MAPTKVIKIFCFALTIVQVLTYVYRPGKRDTQLAFKRQLCVHRSFIKELLGLESREQFEKLFRYGSKLCAESILKKTLEVKRLTKRMEAYIAKKKESRLDEIAFSILKRGTFLKTILNEGRRMTYSDNNFFNHYNQEFLPEVTDDEKTN